MGTPRKRDIGRILFGGFIFSITVFTVMFVITLGKEVISPLWPPLLITLIMSVALCLPLKKFWSWILGKENIALIILTNILVVWPLLLFASLIINMSGSRGEEVQSVEVEKVFTETRYRTRRVSRRVTARGAPYKVYCLRLNISEGTSRNFDVSKKIYDAVSKGDTLKLSKITGLLGLTYVNARSINVPEHIMSRAKEKKKRKLPPNIERYKRHTDSLRHEKFK